MKARTEILNGAVVIPVEDPAVRLPERGLKSRGEFHITLLSPPEVEELRERKGWDEEKFEKRMTGVKVSGIPKYECLGKQEEGENAVYFIVVDWPGGQDFRRRRGFGRKDMHVTLGFRESDIYDAPKGVATCIRKFRKKLKYRSPQ